MRDLVTSQISSRPAWTIAHCMKAVAERGQGVIVILAKAERSEQLLASVDLVLGDTSPGEMFSRESYTRVGLGSQILKDLGVGKIHLMGAPIKYNAISGFDLEVLDFVSPG
jgi:3,4-dihydroxy 2-butanone 4-phosphate synthase/GTP cyclohydrolase II